MQPVQPRGAAGFAVPNGCVVKHDKSGLWSENSITRFKRRVKELTGRSWGVAMDYRLRKLSEFMDLVHEPLAIRSSSVLEDSQYQPFAGVYATYMIPNNHPDHQVRLEELMRSIKLVYASTFARSAKDYMKATAYRLEEEKMAVIIQRMVGATHGDRFYPAFAGVAKSYNFYPMKPQKSEDGIAQVALGLGSIVVDGGITVRFCPKFPRHVVQSFSTNESIRHTQQEFFALNMKWLYIWKICYAAGCLC
jgi:hypothetical protein